MEIIDKVKTTDRDGFDKVYFTVKVKDATESKDEVTYIVIFTLSNGKVIKEACDCAWSTFEVGRKIKTFKVCRHVKYCRNYLKC